MNQFLSKNYFTMPNEIFSLGLDASEIVVTASYGVTSSITTGTC